MKHLFLSILTLLFVQYGLGQSVLQGTIPTVKDQSYQVYIKAISTVSQKDKSLEEEAEVDKAGRFTIKLPLNAPGFFNLSVVVNHSNGNKSNNNTVVWLQPKKTLKINYIPQGTYSLKPNFATTKNKNNKVLLEVQDRFSAIDKTLYEQPVEGFATKEILLQYYSVSDSILNKHKTDPSVRKYIQFLAFDTYNANMYRYGMDLNKLSQEEQALYYTQPKDVLPFLNDELILSFYTGMTTVINQLNLRTGMKPYRRSKSLEQITVQLDTLEELVQSAYIKDQVANRLLENYVSQYREGRNFEQDLKDYTSIAHRIVDTAFQQQTIQAFENLRYTLKNATWVDLPFRTTNGELITLDQFKGKYVFIDVWASWCIPCIQMIPHLQALEEHYKGKNIEFIALSIDSDQNKWLSKVNQLKLEGNQIWDERGEFSKTMNILGIPHYLLYDTEGKLIEYKTAAPNAPQLKVLLDELLKL